jgi:hypothetical protein
MLTLDFGFAQLGASARVLPHAPEGGACTRSQAVGTLSESYCGAGIYQTTCWWDVEYENFASCYTS